MIIIIAIILWKSPVFCIELLPALGRGTDRLEVHPHPTRFPPSLCLGHVAQWHGYFRPAEANGAF